MLRQAGVASGLLARQVAAGPLRVADTTCYATTVRLMGGRAGDAGVSKAAQGMAGGGGDVATHQQHKQQMPGDRATSGNAGTVALDTVEGSPRIAGDNEPAPQGEFFRNTLRGNEEAAPFKFPAGQLGDEARATNNSPTCADAPETIMDNAPVQPPEQSPGAGEYSTRPSGSTARASWAGPTRSVPIVGRTGPEPTAASNTSGPDEGNVYAPQPDTMQDYGPLNTGKPAPTSNPPMDRS